MILRSGDLAGQSGILVSKSYVHRIIVAYKKDSRIERKKEPGKAPKITEKYS